MQAKSNRYVHTRLHRFDMSGYCFASWHKVFVSALEGGTTDHIPVNDNPVYITMKRIDVKKNIAYETVTIPEMSS